MDISNLNTPIIIAIVVFALLVMGAGSLVLSKFYPDSEEKEKKQKQKKQKEALSVRFKSRLIEFRSVIRVLDETGIETLSAAAPWAASLLPAINVGTKTFLYVYEGNYLIALIAGFVVETIGIAAISALYRTRSYNQTKKKSDPLIPESPLLFVVGAYLLVITMISLFVGSATDTWIIRVVSLLFSIFTPMAAIILSSMAELRAATVDVDMAAIRRMLRSKLQPIGYSISNQLEITEEWLLKLRKNPEVLDILNGEVIMGVSFDKSSGSSGTSDGSSKKSSGSSGTNGTGKQKSSGSSGPVSTETPPQKRRISWARVKKDINLVVDIAAMEPEDVLSLYIITPEVAPVWIDRAKEIVGEMRTQAQKLDSV